MTTRPPETAQTISEARCELTELLADQCAHCRPAPQPLTVAAELIQHRFTAEYTGHCQVCDGPIEPGDHIGRLATGGYACPDCCRTAA